MPPKKTNKPAKSNPEAKQTVKPAKTVQNEKPIMEASTVEEELVTITVPDEPGTETLEVCINDRMWRLKRGETVKDVPKEVAVVIQRSIKADKDRYRQYNGMKITASNPFGQAVQA